VTVLDTSFLIDIFRNEPAAVKHLDHLEQEDLLQITAPTIMELWLGALQSNAPEREKARIEEFLEALLVLSFDMRAAKEAAEIEAALLKKGQMIDIEDTMIAGIARSHGEKIVTRDEHFKRIVGLKIETY
jgi:predicted nucleic acid-binding protein